MNANNAKLAAEIAILNTRLKATKTVNTVAGDFPEPKRTFTYKKPGQL